MEVMQQFVDDTASEEVVQSLVETREWMKSKRLELIDTIDALDAFIDEACEAGICVIDLETDGLNTGPFNRGNGSRVAKIAGFCLSYHEGYGVYVPVNHRYGRNIPMSVVLPRIMKLVSACVTLYHNFKFDGELLRNEGVVIEDLNKYEDTLLALAVIVADRPNKGLKGASKDLLNQPMIELSSIVPNKSNIDFCELHPKVAVHYAASDGVCTIGLWNWCKNRMMEMDAQKNNGIHFIYDVEKGCQLGVMEMERALVHVDVEHYRRSDVIISKRLIELEDEIYESAGQPFDMNSNKQLGELLFDKLKIPYPLKDKSKTGGYLVNEGVLDMIASKHTLPAMIVELRKIEKIQSTYLQNLLKNYDENECVKFQLNQTAADSGRFSSRGGKGLPHDGYSGVNAQNIPAAKADDPWKLRKGIKARKGYKIVAIDYSGEELRIVTNLSKEPVWTKEFNEGSGDIHSITASLMFGGTPEEMALKKNKAKRGIAKVANFLIIYGGGASTLAASAKIPLYEAQQHLDNYFTGLAKLSEWMKIERIRARKRGYSLTAFGRRRPLEELYKSGDRALMSKADRLAVNAAVQGTGADIIKIAIYRLWKYIRNHNLQEDARMLFPVHDEIVFEIKDEKLDTLIPIFSEIMKIDDYTKGHLKWEVGLEVDAEYGPNFLVEYDYFKDLEKGITASVRLGMVGGEEPEHKPENVQTPETASAPDPDSVKEESAADAAKGQENMEAEKIETERPVLGDVPPSGEPVAETPGEFFNYEVQKTDSVSRAHADMAWAVLGGIEPYCCKNGIKKRIRLTKDKKVVYTTDKAYSVEGFLALAYNYSI